MNFSTVTKMQYLHIMNVVTTLIRKRQSKRKCWIRLELTSDLCPILSPYSQKKKKLKNPEKGRKGDEIDGFDSTWVTIDSSM